ncbi:regulatory subunit of cyclin-dependent kinase [Hamiltosporidium magnivora]|uniref:Cyclin-dependent kinases regulatory subunit n=1 Tax=Hamiltosporidium magnivora TaxID=148818 RepID=A0A4Q9L0P4_9MICR|nr:regulatory subunit of cyclin-dependent kinase [Hamiltosporidium magnivora]
MNDIRLLQKKITYSERYTSNDYVLRHVILPKEMVHLIPTDRLLTEDEWRQLGVVQSDGWEHYMIYKPEPNILLFRRKKDNNDCQ